MRRPKKYQSGEATQYISRKQALKRLQLTLNDFRRLCILKGIYPREPKHRRRAQKGSTDIKILYHAKDIKFLFHEPIVWTLRSYKIFAKKAGRDRAIQDFRNLNRRLEQFPTIKLDHVVKERYPTFIDAIKDLDDCLTLLFLFSTFPSIQLIPREQSSLCRRLTIEFLHYVIAAKAIRKVFISIKGYYFQADIKGHRVTWIIPHYYPFKPHCKSEVDFKVMSIFVEFYTIMLGFVNFRLYNQVNLVYPPQFPSKLLEDSVENLSNEHSFVADRIAALNFNLLRTDNSSLLEEEENEMDMELLETDTDNAQRIAKYKKDSLDVKKLKVLFKGIKIFINREVPREPLVILIRCFGGSVSWDKSIFPGSTFNENDESITHHIVDRPSLSKQYISRDYVQPQWIFDCVNRRELLPTNKYFIGAILPPHLSPFVDPKREAYVPPEEKALRDPSLIETHEQSDEESDADEDDVNEENEAENLDEQLESLFHMESAEIGESQEEDANEEEEEDNEVEVEEEDKEKIREKEKNNMTVASGKVHRENKRQLKKIEIEEHRLQARMVKSRHRNLFRKLIRDKQAKEKEEWLLKKKRRVFEENVKAEKKQKRKEKKTKMLAE